jgi:hypothetical protein
VVMFLKAIGVAIVNSMRKSAQSKHPNSKPLGNNPGRIAP